jgi:hypothetical protein
MKCSGTQREITPWATFACASSTRVMRDAPAGLTAAGKWQCGLAASHEDVTGGIVAVGRAILIGAATKP